MRWAITGGAGFLGLHLARRLLAEGHEVRTLDLAPLDDPALERSVEELRGDVRDPVADSRLADGADVLVHAAAALPIQASRESIRSVNVDGAPPSSLAAALEAGVRRAVLISSTAVYGVPKHPPDRRGRHRCVGVGHYGESKIEAEAGRAGRRSSRARGRDPAPEDVHRPGAARRLRDPLRLDPRGPADSHPRRRLQPLPAARCRGPGRGDRVRGERAVAGETFNVGATEFGTVRSDLEAPDRARWTRAVAYARVPVASGRARPTGARTGAALAAR